MTEKYVIFFDEQKYEHEMYGTKIHVQIAQDIVNLWKELTGMEAKTSDLKTILTGNLSKLKELVFDKLTNQNAKDTTLFGLKVRKDKALDMLDMPEIEPIIKERERFINEVVKNFNLNIEIEFLQIKSGKVILAPGYENRVKELHTIYAETEEEKERAKHLKAIQKAWETLITKQLVNAGTGQMKKYLRYNSMTKQFEPNYFAIKTGRVH